MVQQQAYAVTQGFGEFMVVLAWDDAEWVPEYVLVRLYGTISKHRKLTATEVRDWIGGPRTPILLHVAEPL